MTKPTCNRQLLLAHYQLALYELTDLLLALKIDYISKHLPAHIATLVRSNHPNVALGNTHRVILDINLSQTLPAHTDLSSFLEPLCIYLPTTS